MGALSTPSAGIAEAGEQGEADNDHGGAEQLAAGDSLPCQDVSEGHREDHCGDEQRLNDREPAPIERRSLQDDADSLQGEPEQPHALRRQAEERSRMTERDVGEVQCGPLPERRRKREDNRSGEREDCGFSIHRRAQATRLS